eukprot:scaffold74057_cov20-Tisochrysis_lutea.AAC.3
MSHQVEAHPNLRNDELLQFNKAQGIHVTVGYEFQDASFGGPLDSWRHSGSAVDVSRFFKEGMLQVRSRRASCLGNA